MNNNEQFRLIQAARNTIRAMEQARSHFMFYLEDELGIDMHCGTQELELRQALWAVLQSGASDINGFLKKLETYEKERKGAESRTRRKKPSVKAPALARKVPIKRRVRGNRSR